MRGVDWPSVVVAFLGIFALLLIALSVIPHKPLRRPRSDSEQQ